MNGPFWSAIKFKQRSRRFTEVNHPYLQSWKLEIRADYVAIDQYHRDAFQNVLREEVLAEADMEENRLERFIYSMEGDGNCRFRNYYETDGDTEQGVVYQNVDYAHHPDRGMRKQFT